jgi:O-antigen/teichoic acid export membrane protein
MKLVDLVRFRIDNLVIARFVSVGSVGPYSVGMSLINYFRQLIESLGGVLMPVFSHSEGMGERKLLQEQLVVAIKLSATLSVFAGGSLLLYGGFFIERWLGAGFGDSYKVMLILAPAFILALAQNPGIYLLFGISRQGRLIRLNTIEAVLNFAFSIGLVWKFGVFGVAAGTAISLFVSKIILQPWILCEETGLPLSRYWIDALLLPILKTSLPMLVVYRVILPWLRPDYGVLMLTVLVQAAVVLPVAWLLLFGKSERERIARVFSRRTDG